MFVRIDPKQAGPNALGILVPHGARTLVILRPRALAWDLLPARWNGDVGHAPDFCVFGRDEAAAAARRLLTSLDNAVVHGINPVQTCGDHRGERFQVWLKTDEFVWIACRRTPGSAYQPMIFATREEAVHEAEKIAAVAWPAVETRQEVYFNTQNFS